MNKNISNPNKGYNHLNKGKKQEFYCIKTQDLAVSFGENKILENINIHINWGKITTIIGRNGAGKSTLMKAILGDVPYKGKILFQDIDKNKLSDIKVGYVPQHINIERNTPTSVYDLFASFHSRVPVFLHKSKRVYQEIKELLGLLDAQDLIDKRVCDLSGGELQRVLLAIAINPIPNLLLLDEPVSGMDRNGMELFYSTINRLKDNYKLPIIMISHDFEFVKKYSDYVILLDKTIVQEGSPKEVFNSKEFAHVFGSAFIMSQ